MGKIVCSMVYKLDMAIFISGFRFSELSTRPISVGWLHVHNVMIPNRNLKCKKYNHVCIFTLIYHTVWSGDTGSWQSHALILSMFCIHVCWQLTLTIGFSMHCVPCRLDTLLLPFPTLGICDCQTQTFKH